MRGCAVASAASAPRDVDEAVFGGVRYGRGVDSSFRLLWKGSVMTPVCCPRCRVRFTPDVVAYLVMCPECGGPVERIASFERAVGFRLFGPQDIPHSLPRAVAVSIPVPESSRARS